MATGTQERTKRPTSVENITVLQVGEWGVRVGEKLWFGVNEPLTPSHFVPETSYKVAVTVSKTGKKYISEIIGTEDRGPAQAAVPAQAAASPATSAPAETAKAAALVTSAAKAPQTGKDKIITMLALYKSALENPALAQWATNPEEHIALIRKYATELLKDIHE